MRAVAYAASKLPEDETRKKPRSNPMERLLKVLATTPKWNLQKVGGKMLEDGRADRMQVMLYIFKASS